MAREFACFDIDIAVLCELPLPCILVSLSMVVATLSFGKEKLKKDRHMHSIGFAIKPRLFLRCQNIQLASTSDS